MPEASSKSVVGQLQKAIDAQERVKQAARDAAAQAARPPTTPQAPAAPQGGTK